MKDSKNFVAFAYSNAYFSGKCMKRNYSVGICTAKGSLSKRWYIRWSFGNSKTAQFQKNYCKTPQSTTNV